MTLLKNIQRVTEQIVVIIEAYYCYQLHTKLRFVNQKFTIKKNRTLTLHVVVYGCETWSVTCRKQHRLRVFENKAEEDIWA